MEYEKDLKQTIEDRIRSKINKYTIEELEQKYSEISYSERIVIDYYFRCMNERTSFYISFAQFVNEKDFINKLIDNDEFDYIIKYFKDMISGFYIITDKLLDYLKENLYRINKDDLNTIYQILCSVMSKNKRSNKDELIRFLLNTAERENATLFDFHCINEGGFSNVFKLNDTIVKIGKPRFCNEIVDNSRIFLPRYKGFVGSDFIEVTDYINDESKVTSEDAYSIYSELRDQRVLWLDPTCKNIKRITDNLLEAQEERKFRLKELGVLENKYKLNRELKAGDYVIVDLDHMIFNCDRYKDLKKLDERGNLIVSIEKDFDRRYCKEYRLHR